MHQGFCQLDFQTLKSIWFLLTASIAVVVTAQNVTITPQNRTALTISWLPCPRYGNILQYRVSCSAAGSGVPHSSYNLTAETHNQTFPDLRLHTRYNCCISVITTLGERTVCISEKGMQIDLIHNGP